MPGLLEALRAEGYAVAHGVMTSRGKLDHVVIGPTGAFAMETRGWRGSVTLASGPRLTVDGRDEHATVRNARGAANDVQTKLSRARVPPWVEAVVVLPEDAALSRPRMPILTERVTVVRADHLIALIREHGGRLSPDEIARAAAALG